MRTKPGKGRRKSKPYLDGEHINGELVLVELLSVSGDLGEVSEMPSHSTIQTYSTEQETPSKKLSKKMFQK